jgi:molybdenum cofactor synthesis domain-containing protein
MRPLKSLISLEEAKERVRANISPMESIEDVDIDLAVNRVLAEEVVSSLDIPPYSRAAMDGYAVRAEDTFKAGKYSPVHLRCLDNVHAGEVPKIAVEEGTCIQIATGAMIPEGANAVMKVENTEREEGDVLMFTPVYPGAYVSKREKDVKEGSSVLSPGAYLAPSRVGVLAAIGRDRVNVYARPRIAIIPTGDEVAPVGGELRNGQVYDINSHTLQSMVRENGCEPVVHPIVMDEWDSLASKLKEAASTSDMIVLSGGSSAGERDVLEDVLKDMGELIFHGVQIKPGKPTIFAIIEGKPLFGMPGYPTSCLTNGYIFLVDAVRKLARLPEREFKVLELPLGKRLTSQLGRHMFLTVAVRDGEVFPVFKESGTITSMAYADGWIEIPTNVDLIDKGVMVRVTIFQ